MISRYKNIIGLLIIIAICVAVYISIRSNQPTASVEPAPSNGKLNINVVCESALAYMTFPDGKSADAFVADCKEGKYPEVIENYKKQMNLGVGAQI